MLHHQHSVAMPANHRDARLGQVPMRLQQQQQPQQPPLQQPQQRPILMGMQPQAGAPGVLTMPTNLPAASVVAATAPITQQISSGSKNGGVSGIASPLLGVTANDGEQAVTPGHQRQQQPTSTQLNGNTTSTTTSTSNLANTKEKTPMCLVNELARFNKIQHQYRLTNEQGPAHKKRFTVTLKLGEEEYSAEGASIKKAQHSAAGEALQHTQYKHPPPKTQRNIRLGKSNITPTVELNALAMKRGEPAVYTFIEPPHPHGNHSGAPHNPYLPPPAPPGHSFNYRGMYNQVRGYPNFDQNRRVTGSRGAVYSQYDNQRYHHYGKGPGSFQPSLFVVGLRVGAREFLGEGPTAQAARHDAASKALHQLKSLPMPEDTLQHCDAGIQENGTTCGIENDPNADLKSPISLVHEIALKRNLQVNFEVVSEKGPPHMRTFVTKCTVGDKMTTGEGNGKKRHDFLAPNVDTVQESNISPPTCGIENDPNADLKSPISLVHEIALKRNLQVNFEVVSEKGPPHMRTFVTKCTVGDKMTTGEGNGKKRHDFLAPNVDTVQESNISPPTCGIENDPNADLKSPISLVHEIALKRNLQVNFEVVSEKGPPHMRTFVTKCTVGDKMTTGEGNGKKVSKKRAAEKMLEELKKLPPQSPTNMAASMARLKRKANPGKKKTRNLIKVYQQEQKAEPEYGEDINPISRLIQIQQAKKEREPVYSLLEERGVPRRREFVMEVSIGQHSCTGTGPNKKLAKRAAAEGLLQLLGYSRPTVQPTKPSIKTGDTNQDMDKSRKVTFLEEDKVVELPTGGSSGRQLVPGLLLMADNTAGNYGHTPTKNSGVNLQTTAAIAKELLKGGNSPTAEALVKSAAGVGGHKNSAAAPNMAKSSLQQQTQSSQVVRPKDQLLYLAQLLGFQVQFSDFPKGNHSEFLSLVSLSTDPPQVCHGAGQTTDASHDQAALTALRALSEMGLDSVAPTGGGMKKESVQQGPQGDSLHLAQSGVQKAGGMSLGK